MLKNIALYQLEILTAISVIQGLALNNPSICLVALGLMIFRIEVIKPYFDTKKPHIVLDSEIESLIKQIDEIKRELNTIKLDKVIRSFNG
jgi:hypothetical protein